MNRLERRSRHVLCLAAGALAGTLVVARVSGGGYPRRSWVRVAECPSAVAEDTDFAVKVDYHLDESEIPAEWPERAAIIFCWPNYATQKQRHQTFGGGQTIRIEPGRGSVTFTARAPEYETTKSLTLIFWLAPSAKQRWQHWGLRWDRVVLIQRTSGILRLRTSKLMNVFTYGEPVDLRAVLTNLTAKDIGQTWELRYRIFETGGAEVDVGSQIVKVTKQDQEVPIPWRSRRRGCMCLEVEFPGRDKAETTFAIIPPMPEATEAESRRFGLNYVFGFGYAGPVPADVMEENAELAKLLGAKVGRTWMLWSHFEPEPGLRRWEHWDTVMALSQKHGLDVNLLIYRYPAWAQEPDSTGAKLRPGWWSNPPRNAEWAKLVSAVATRYKERLYAIEFGNEPNPMGAYWHGTAQEYARHLEAGQKAVKSVAPQIVTTMAGGPFPLPFFSDILAAGGGEHVDVIPLHYANAGSCAQYRATMTRFGIDKPIWDNETGRGWSCVQRPFREDMKHWTTCDWIATHFTECLSRGVECLMYFLLRSNSWGLCRVDGSVRPGFAAYAVYASKLLGAEFLGEFPLTGSATGYLFERRGKPLLMAWSTKDESAPVAVGTDELVVTDLQGNERKLSTPGGRARLPLGVRAAYFEGGDLDVLKAYVVPELAPRQTTALAGREQEFVLHVRNRYERGLKGTAKVSVPEGWPAVKGLAFSVLPGEEASVPFAVSVPTSAKTGDAELAVDFRFDREGLPTVSRSANVLVIDPSMIGNMLGNGDFEEGDGGAVGWRGASPDTVLWEKHTWPGFGKRCMRLQNIKPGWVWLGGPPCKVEPGQTYLYSAWVWSQRTSGGSNLSQTRRDGSKARTLYNTQVFAIADSEYWKLYTCKYTAPADVVRVGLSPVIGKSGNGGWALFDNLGFRLYDGTDFMAECLKATKPVRPDGKLDEWRTSSPILLVGQNQVKASEGCDWSPQNASAVAYAMWDDSNFYLAVEVSDQEHVPGSGGVTDGDHLVLSIDPARKTADSRRAAFEVVLAKGDGGGVMFRPSQRCGLNARSGNLNVDGAVSACAVREKPGGLVYEMILPIAEMRPFAPGFARKLGFSLTLVDRDTDGKAATVQWGAGTGQDWDPSLFGVLTLIGK